MFADLRLLVVSIPIDLDLSGIELLHAISSCANTL
jgi:hypothetical protein